MLKEEETKARRRKMETINIKIKQKLESYQELYMIVTKTILVKMKKI
jgi:DNA mismatch repair protein MutS2